MGYSNIIIVKEQSDPDGTFPTCTLPNPEVEEAMELGIEYCKKYNADLLLGTDPDCDRVGVAIKDYYGNYKLLNGNEIGILLLDYILSILTESKMLPKKPIVLKTIVTTDLAEKIAKHYGVKIKNTLTGFKYIGEQINILDKKNANESFVFGMEESHGYLRGTYVKDKDGVVSSLLISEMIGYYKLKNINLMDKLLSLYCKYGFYKETQLSYKFEGIRGKIRMSKIMDYFRNDFIIEYNKIVLNYIDYIDEVDDLPKSNVLEFLLANKCKLIIRPSGTEPKLKMYITAIGKNEEEAIKNENTIYAMIKKIMSNIPY